MGLSIPGCAKIMGVDGATMSLCIAEQSIEDNTSNSLEFFWRLSDRKCTDTMLTEKQLDVIREGAAKDE